MRNARVWRTLLGVEKTVVESVEFEVDGGGGQLIVQVRVTRAARSRCGMCRRPCGRYDAGQGRRRWRALDAGTIGVFVEADAPRVRCAEHGVVVAHVPWARHGAGHTLAFDETVAWLVTQCSKSAVTELMRIAWRTVGAIIARVWADVEALGDRLDGLRRIGIDEISYKRGHRYLTVVVDHDSGRLLWAAPGRDQATLRTFFDAARPRTRARRSRHVSADPADWIAEIVAERCPNAVRCADPFHVVKWATEALDEVRRQAWNEARRPGRPAARATATASPPATPAGSRPPATRCGRTPRTSPTASGTSWPGSPRPTPGCTAPTCSKKACATSSGQGRGRQDRPGPVAVLGPPLPHPRLRAPRPTDHHDPRQDPRHARPRPVQRADRIGQHQDPTAHPPRLRLPLSPTP